MNCATSFASWPAAGDFLCLSDLWESTDPAFHTIIRASGLSKLPSVAQDLALARVFRCEMLTMNPTFMKRSTVLLLLSLSLPLISSFGQTPPARPVSPPFGQAPLPPPELPAFDLDFPGGRPADLVAAIQKASGGPLNAIIPDEYAQKQLPAMKMKGVNAAKLFEALESSSHRTVPVITGLNNFGFGGGRGGSTPSYNYTKESYGFKTQGTPREDSIWYFEVDETKTPAFLLDSESGPTNVCRFYQLEPYLQADYKVEDITTAITTGWKMLGVKPVPTLNFHKETKLLIAVGQQDSLAMIDQVLAQLKHQASNGRVGATPAAPATRRPSPFPPSQPGGAGADQP
jgi:hypothetical protein